MTDTFLYSSCRAQSCHFQQTVCTLEVGPCKSPANPGACIPKFCAKIYVTRKKKKERKKTETQASCIVSLHLKSQSALGKLNNLFTYTMQHTVTCFMDGSDGGSVSFSPLFNHGCPSSTPTCLSTTIRRRGQGEARKPRTFILHDKNN